MAQSYKQNIVLEWFSWQFYEMPGFLLFVWKNYLRFATNYFSVPLLLKTFLSPWRRYSWVYPKGFDIMEIFSTFISNIFSRFIGAIIRTFLIVFGLLFQIFVLVAGLIILLFWIFMPFLIVMGFIFCLTY
jgi:hypothetical protein